MINSTRSSESASRSSWKDASSVTSLSSTPSCSTRTSLTRSKTSSREAAMSPLSGVGFRKRADANTLLTRFLGFLGHSLAQARDDAVVDPARAETNRVRDRRARRVAVRNHGEPAQAEEVCAAVRVGIEMLPEPARRGLDQQPAGLAACSGRDLAAQPVERRPDRPFEQL